MADSERAEDSAEVQQAAEGLTQAESELAQLVSQTLLVFDALLPADVDRDDWEAWWVEGWCRQFCRQVSLDTAFAGTLCRR